MMNIEKPGSGRFVRFLVFSCLVHVTVLFLLYFIPQFLFFSELHKRLDHKIEDKTEDLITQIELINEEDQRLQVVEQSENSVNEQAPTDAKFLSAKNQKVEQQTKAANTGDFNNSSLPGFTSVGSEDNDSATEEDFTEKTKDLGLNGISLSKKLEQKVKKKSKRSYSSLGDGISQTDDHLKDIDEGAQTLLNTKEFIHYSFFMRVKYQLKSHWSPLIRKNVEFLYVKNRNIAGVSDKATSVRVTLNTQGYLVKVELLKTSGYKELDTAAIQAFRAAAPFLNPPKGLVENDKFIRIVWDFILES